MRALHKNQICPLHRSKMCCGRAPKREITRKYYYAHGVKRIPDANEPEGYREVCSPSQLDERKNVLIRRGEKCAACGEGFHDYRDVDLAHKTSKGSGGGKRNDILRNLTLMHRSENHEQGSMTLVAYLEWRRKRNLPIPEAGQAISVERVIA